MNTKQLKEQANKLEDYINNGTVTEKDWGLCSNALHVDIPNCALFSTWEHFSGSYASPIEGNIIAYIDNDRKHDRRTKYGKLRLSLAKHCLEWTLTQLREPV